MPTVTTFTANTPEGLAKALADRPHRMYLYLEYTNDASTPSYTSAQLVPGFLNPKAYYDGLSSPQNYLRVPAIQDPSLSKSLVGSVAGCTITFFGQSNTLTAGVNPSGAPLSDGVSKCYGAALVLAVDDEDKSQDLVVARAYFTDAPLTKTASSEIFVTFPFTVSITAP
jgi:hypothetical protein